MQRLQIVQNRLIKTLFNYPFRTPTSKIYKETQVMHLKQLYTFKTCLLIHKIVKKYIHTQITFKTKINKYSRRKKYLQHLQISKSRTEFYGKRTLTHGGVKLYNKLPIQIRTHNSIILFRKCLKKYVSETIYI
jgi:uncharacterized protein YgiM (DUF1202 family)